MRARIVTVTSTAHHMGRAVDPRATRTSRAATAPWRAYGQSKLANFQFGLGLDSGSSRQAGAPAASLIAHPGLSNTDLQAVSVQETGGGRSQRFFHSLAGSQGMSPARGALLAAARGDRPGCEGRRVLRAEVGQQRTAGAQADLPPDRHDRGDRIGSGRSPSARPGSCSRSLDGRRRSLAASRDRRCGRSGCGGAAGAARARRRARLPRRVDERRRRRGGRRHRHGVHPLRLEGRAGARHLPGDQGRAGRARRRPSFDRHGRRGRRFRQMWLAAYTATSPPTATTPCSCSRSTARPTRADAHEAAMARDGDPLVRGRGAPTSPTSYSRFRWRCSTSSGWPRRCGWPRAGRELTQKQLRATADACWRAVSRD